MIAFLVALVGCGESKPALDLNKPQRQVVVEKWGYSVDPPKDWKKVDVPMKPYQYEFKDEESDSLIRYFGTMGGERDDMKEDLRAFMKARSMHYRGFAEIVSDEDFRTADGVEGMLFKCKRGTGDHERAGYFYLFKVNGQSYEVSGWMPKSKLKQILPTIEASAKSLRFHKPQKK